MNRFLIAFLAFASPAFATDSRTEAVREIGSVLGWRLGPAAIEEHCRAIDPDGDAGRHAAVKIWQQKNEKLIKSVDDAILEVLPMIETKAPAADVFDAVRSQVKQAMLEATFQEASPE